MSINFSKPTYEELLKIAKDQELEIERLHSKEHQIANFDFYLNQSIDLVCIAGTDGFYKEINETFIKTFGYTKEEILKKKLLDFIHPDDLEVSNKVMHDLKLGKNSFNFENRIVRKDGEIAIIQWTTSVDLQSDLVYAIGRDVTEMRLIQNKLATSERLLNDAQKLAKMGSWELNVVNYKLIFSDELYAIFETDKSLNLAEEYKKFISDEEIVLFKDRLTQLKNDLQSFDFEYEITFPSKRKKWIYVMVVPVLDDEGKLILIRGNTQDISERKENDEKLKIRNQSEIQLKLQLIEEESNAKFKKYIEYAPDGVFLFDEKGTYLEVNPAATTITGFTAEELLKLSTNELALAESKEKAKFYLQTLITEGKASGELKTRTKNGELRWCSFDAVKIANNRYLGFLKDITDRKEVQELLSKTFERITDAFVALDNKWCYTYMNQKAGEIVGRNPEDMIGQCIWTEFPETLLKPFHDIFKESFETQQYKYFEEFHEPSQRWIANHLYPSPDGISNFFTDITEKKNADAILEKNEKRFRALVENNQGIITVIDQNLKILFRSSSSARVTGYTDEEFDAIMPEDYYHPDYIDYVNKMIQESISKPNTPLPVLFQVKHRDGRYIWLEGVLNNMLNDDSVEGIIANLRDVTERRNVIDDLINERDKFAKIAATSPGLIYSMRQNLDGLLSYPYASDAIKEIYGLSFEEVQNDANSIFKRIHTDDIDYVIEKILNTKRTLVPLKGAYRYFHPVKGLVWHEVNSLPVIEPEGTVICHGIITDITDRIIAEQKIVKANRLYLFISQINQMIVRTTDEKTLFREACKIAVEWGKFKMAWIGLLSNNSKKLKPVMTAGDTSGYVDHIRAISLEDINNGNGPGALVIRDEKYIVCNDIQNDDLMKPWRAEALACGYHSVMALPIKKFGKLIGVFTIYSGDKDFFDDQEIALLEEATGDVSFALEVFEKEIQRKKAEEAVFQSEKRYHTLTEVSPVGIFRTDASGYTTYVNPSWTQISGLPYQRALGNGWLDAVHEEDRTAILNGWENATIKNEKSLSEYRFVRPDGTVAWVMGQAIPEKNSDNEIVGYIGTITDITDRKNGEEEFKKVNKKLEGILDAIPDLLFEVGKDGHFYNFHSHHTDMLAIHQSEFIGKKFIEVLPPDVAKISLLAVEEAAQKGFSIGKQYQMELPNGLYWFELSVAQMKLSEEDDQPHFICLSRDITAAKKGEFALQKSEERYRGLLNNLDAGIIVHSSDSTIIMSNKKASELLGLNVEDILGKKTVNRTWKFINEDGTDMEFDQYPINQILNSTLPIKNMVLGIYNPKNKTVLWALINGFPIVDEEGSIVEAVISFIDITDRIHMENQITKSKEQAEAASKAKTDFLANMSHEIRTPLNGIIGFTHLLMKSKLDFNQLEYMSTVNESAKSLMQIVNDVLDFSKIESGKLELDIDEVDLFELTGQVVDLFKHQANDKKIDLKLSIDLNIPKLILADSVRLKQILVNLLSNSLKFTNFGEIVLEIKEVMPTTDTITSIKFSVKDTGIGIKVNNNKKIFGSFVQEDNSTSRKFGGTGLGLTISNQLLGLMGSTLELNSIYGEGSDFYFTIQFKKALVKKLNENLIVENVNVETANPVKILSHKNIMIVEDNKINMLLAKTLIKRIVPNCTIFQAYDGNEAIEQFKKYDMDAIFMDIQMPNKNGYEATTEIRILEEKKNTPIIAITAGILVGEKEKCFSTGMNDYLPKPIIIKDLENIIEKWLTN